LVCLYEILYGLILANNPLPQAGLKGLSFVAYLRSI